MTYKELLNECLLAIKNGDETKFYDLQQLTYGPLINVAKGYLMDNSDADAVMSDFYYKIYRYADHYDSSRDAQAYLWQIVKNKAFDYNRQRIKNNTVNLDELQIFDPNDPYEQINTKIDVLNALKRVGPVNAMIAVWTYRDGLTLEEIGERLGVTKAAVCQRLNRTREKLSQYLKEF